MMKFPKWFDNFALRKEEQPFIPVKLKKINRMTITDVSGGSISMWYDYEEGEEIGAKWEDFIQWYSEPNDTDSDVFIFYISDEIISFRRQDVKQFNVKIAVINA